MKIQYAIDMKDMLAYMHKQGKIHFGSEYKHTQMQTGHRLNCMRQVKVVNASTVMGTIETQERINYDEPR